MLSLHIIQILIHHCITFLYYISVLVMSAAFFRVFLLIIWSRTLCNLRSTRLISVTGTIKTLWNLSKLLSGWVQWLPGRVNMHILEHWWAVGDGMERNIQCTQQISVNTHSPRMKPMYWEADTGRMEQGGCRWCLMWAQYCTRRSLVVVCLQGPL